MRQEKHEEAHVSVVAVAGFLLGLLVAPAYAVSHTTGYYTIFGNSSSCALGQGSINDTSHKSGAVTVNRQGCNANNAAVGVPGGYIQASTRIYRFSHSWWCSNFAFVSNPDASPQISSVTITSALVTSSYCPATAAYQGLSSHIRKKAAGGEVQIELATGIYTFN